MSEIWNKLREEAEIVATKERILSKILTEYVLERSSLADALSWRISERLAKGSVPANDLKELLFSSFKDSPSILVPPMRIRSSFQEVGLSSGPVNPLMPLPIHLGYHSQVHPELVATLLSSPLVWWTTDLTAHLVG